MNEELFGKKKLPFEVPENYFEDFENKMLRKFQSESAEKPKEDSVAALISVVKPWLAMAASFVLIALIYYQVPDFFGNSDEVTNLQEVEDDFINSLALIIDEEEINELILSEDSALELAPDSILFGSFTEEELAAVTYFE